MIEAPEAHYLAEQLNLTIKGKKITYVLAGYSPHKFAWFYEGPEGYPSKLLNKTVGETTVYGGLVEISVHDVRLLLGDGINVNYLSPGDKLPHKHQLLIGFEDQSCLVASVRMYGGILCFYEGAFDSPFKSYYDSAKSKPQVMSDAFDKEYFFCLINEDGAQNKTAKAFLATGQAVPGLGNGVLQDILYTARIHPKTKIMQLSLAQREGLFHCIKNTMHEIYRSGGRNTETDLFGKSGGYIPFLGKNTVGKPCARCGEDIRKESYLGGSIYYCFGCQKLQPDVNNA